MDPKITPPDLLAALQSFRQVAPEAAEPGPRVSDGEDGASADENLRRFSQAHRMLLQQFEEISAAARESAPSEDAYARLLERVYRVRTR
jgi:hypothetical protein